MGINKQKLDIMFLQNHTKKLFLYLSELIKQNQTMKWKKLYIKS
jgi:hypothetical protein